MLRIISHFFLVILLAALILAAYAAVKIKLFEQQDDEVGLAGKREYLRAVATISEAQPEPRPNIVFVLYDDLGYGDLGAYGNIAIKTPRIDEIAEKGVRLTGFYSPAAVCTPARAGYLTGRLPPRAGVTSVYFPDKHPAGYKNKVFSDTIRMPAEEITMADILKAAGYQTGMVGKWHLGDIAPSLPNDFGFDSFYGALYSNDMEPFAWYRNRKIDVSAPADQTRMTEVYTSEATRFINNSAKQRQPFFLYFAHNFPHIPLHVRSSRLGQSDAGLYGDVMEEADSGLGAIVDALKTAGVLDNTIIIITSDNGPWYEGDPGNLRGRKSQTLEGGMRVPFIAWWPGKIEGGRTLEGLSMGTDLLPTIVDWLKLPLPGDRIIDGRSIAGMLSGKQDSPHDYLYYFSGNKLKAVRDHRFKFQQEREFYYGIYSLIGLNKKSNWLFDMKSDPRESYEVSDRHPNERARMQTVFDIKAEELNTNPRGWK